ncbi:T9SS type B sorting domain-containing protein [Algibacter sp. 2305UL17-15]|uniref:T9SS type B sorting domain-containing protein n=1 Tax=Algibacter sp. 2305UL17-15 TaxID=3231268 RepID=UPI003457CEFB
MNLQITYSQNEANVWYFGFGAGLDFSTGSPIAITDGQLYTREGCASISNNCGNIIFYTDGVTVYNKNHQIMQNGTGLFGDSSSTHSAIIVPMPGNEFVYYIFTVDDQDEFENKGLRYSLVDMNLDSGLGGVTTKNILLYDRVPEKVTAFKKLNSDSYWIVSQKYNTNEFIAYELNSSGVIPNPIISTVGVNNGPLARLSGQIKISPDGTKLALANGWEVQLFNFDSVTGLISNPITLLQNINSYGVEFSQNSDLLYVAYYEGVCQFDLSLGTEAEIENSKAVLISSSGESFGSLQLGPDGKIYLTKVNGEYLDVIDYPDNVGLSCNFLYNHIYLQGRTSFLGLPTFVSNNISSEIGNITFLNTCYNEVTQFQLNSSFDSVLWDFDDPTSGLDNTSSLVNPSHTFTSPGTYNVSASVNCGSETDTIEVEIIVSDIPLVNQIDNLYSCEDSFGSQISSTFDTSTVESDLIGNLSDLTIKYFDSNGIELPSPLPNPMSNSILGQETITARVSNSNNLACITEITFDLIVSPLPPINEVNDIYACDDNYDGITEFDISNLEILISDNQPGMIIEFFRENGQQLPNPLPNSVQNIVINQETITARITNPNTNCYNERTFDLIVNPLPEVNQLQIIYGCDDNNDGISEHFDTSNVESQVLNGQTGISVNYFDQLGNELPNPLPNPYTNFYTFNESITLRVTANNTTCYAETTLQLQTVTQPNINQPNNLYACDQGNGYAEFNTSIIEQQLIGNQTGLTIQYFDSNNNPLPSPLPTIFQNTEPFSQTINIRIEDASNPICYSETSFNLIVNELPEINLEDEYFICNLDPSISLNISAGHNSYNWFFEDGTLISGTNGAEITEEGSYTLTVTQIENGITCENSFDFNLIRSVLPEIQQVNYGELGNNYIEITASGDGDFEYSIDGINYKNSNYFSNIQGGIYTVIVRDKDGCGENSDEVIIIDYPKFFTPNNDGYNDFWQIKGISHFPNSTTLIFDRYGKLLARISANELGWNGLYNGKQMMSNDYWFRTNLGNGRTFSGHFSLKR